MSDGAWNISAHDKMFDAALFEHLQGANCGAKDQQDSGWNHRNDPICSNDGRVMKYPLMLLSLAAAVAVNPVTAQEASNKTTTEPGLGRWVRVEATVKAPVAEVWRVFTTSEGAEEFFAQKANIRLAIGGPYEIQFDPKNEQSGTKGLKVLSYAPEEMISFQWNAPTEYPEVRNGGTWVVVQIRPEGTDRTHVTVTHYGWKDGVEWDQAYAHFVRGWGDLKNRLERRFNDGPIDWDKERMIYKEAKERKP